MKNKGKLNIEQLINEGLNAHKSGDLELAYTKYNKAIKLASNHPKLLYFFGILENQRNKNEHAERLLEQCSKLVPNDADIEYNLGTVCQQLGKHKKAVKRYLNATAVNPGLFLAHLNLGATYIQLKEYEAAIPCLETALELSSSDNNVLFNLAKAHHNLGHWQQSYGYTQRVQSSSTLYVDALLLSADSLCRDNKHKLALDTLRDSLDSVGNKSTIFNKMGDVHFSQKDYDAAKDCYVNAIEENPGNNDAYTSLGRLFYTIGELDNALDWLNIGSERCADVKLIKNNLALIHLANGQLLQGWKHYIDRTIDRPHSKQPPFPKLEPDLTGQTIFLVPDQGIGDQLFFLRFIPLLLQRHANVNICVNEKLRPALGSSTIADLLVSMRQIPLEGEIYELGDLPYLLNCGDNDFVPPLTLKTDSNTSLIASNGLPNIGISWRGGIADSKTLYKEIDLTTFLTTLKNINANWYILQRHPTPEELIQAHNILGDNIYDVSELNEDLETMLKLLNQLDDHIGVSNTNVHLRSSLEKTGKVLIPTPPDWRWLTNVDISPWVPGYKTYRQKSLGDWGQALDELATDLRQQFGQVI